MDVKNCDLCRLCLASINGCDETLLNNNNFLIKSIFLITGLEVVSSSGQCEYLCKRCQSLLEQCVEFRETCIYNDGVFREMLVSIPTEDCKSELQEPVVKCELQESVDEFIKLEPVDLAEPAGIASELLENNANLPHEAPEPSVERRKKSKRNRAESVRTESVESSVERKRKSEKTNDESAELLKSKEKTRKYPNMRKFKKVKCEQCGLVMGYNSLKKHQEVHDPNRKKLPCPHCSKEYVDRYLLKQHIDVSHIHKIQYNCDQCPKSYVSQCSLTEHYLAKHSGEKRYVCEICGDRFARASSRSYHQKSVHTTGRPHSCSYCHRTFKVKTELTNHIRSSHIGKRRPPKKAKEVKSEQLESTNTDEACGFSVQQDGCVFTVQPV